MISSVNFTLSNSTKTINTNSKSLHLIIFLTMIINNQINYIYIWLGKLIILFFILCIKYRYI
jgi:hypothetical protein